MYFLGTYRLTTSKGKDVYVGFFDRFIRKSMMEEDDFDLYLYAKYKRRKKRKEEEMFERVFTSIFRLSK